MLQHMWEAQSGNSIVDGMDIRRRIGHVLIAHIGSWISSIPRRTMIRAGITALVRRQRQRSVHWNQLLAESGERRVDVVGVHGDDVVGRVAGHVLVHDGEDVDGFALVGLEDVAGAEETAFFARVEVELEGVGWCEFGVGEDAQGLEDDDDALNRWSER